MLSSTWILVPFHPHTWQAQPQLGTAGHSRVVITGPVSVVDHRTCPPQMQVWTLIQSCWKQDPLERPAMSQVAR